MNRIQSFNFKEFYKLLDETVKGWCSYEDAYCLWTLAQRNNHSSIVVEIGSAWGKSTIVLAEALRQSSQGKVYSIDPHTGSIGYLKGLGVDKINSFPEFWNNIQRFDLARFVEPIVETSVKAAETWNPALMIDLLYIDGIHEAEAVEADMKSWLHLVKPGGVIIFDDYFNESCQAYREKIDHFLGSSSQYQLPLNRGGRLVYCLVKKPGENQGLEGKTHECAANSIRDIVTPGSLVFDIGANVGRKIEAYLALQAGKIVAVEPQPSCIEKLQSKYAGVESIVLVEKAIGKIPGKLDMQICDQSNALSTMSTTWQKGRFSQKTFTKKISVEVTTLDLLIKAWGLPKFCKIDVEGFEYEVLKGLSYPVPYLSFEFASEFLDMAKQCLNRLVSLGYKEFNFSEAETSRFKFNHWVSYQELLNFFETTPKLGLWGDVYAAYLDKLEPKNSKIRKSSSSGSGRMAVRDKFSDIRGLVQSRFPVIVDGGAHKGETTSIFLKDYPDSKIYSFEPNPSLSQYLIKRYYNHSNVTVVDKALGAKSGKVTFKTTKYSPSSSVLKPTPLNRKYHSTKMDIIQEVSVQQTRLDEFLLSLPYDGVIDILKLDLQGYELEALKGSLRLLDRVRLVLSEVEFVSLYENQCLFSDIDLFLRSHGFRLINLYELWTHPDGQLTSGDALYLNENFRSTIQKSCTTVYF